MFAPRVTSAEEGGRPSCWLFPSALRCRDALAAQLPLAAGPLEGAPRGCLGVGWERRAREGGVQGDRSHTGLPAPGFAHQRAPRGERNALLSADPRGHLLAGSSWRGPCRPPCEWRDGEWMLRAWKPAAGKGRSRTHRQVCG